MKAIYKIISKFGAPYIRINRDFITLNNSVILGLWNKKEAFFTLERKRDNYFVGNATTLNGISYILIDKNGMQSMPLSKFLPIK